MKFDRSASQVAYQEYLQQLKEFQQRLKLLEQKIEEQAKDGIHAPMIQTLPNLLKNGLL